MKELSSQTPKVTIIIPVFNKVDLTSQCVDHLYKVTPNHLFELIIVDNGSQDGTAHYLSSLTKHKNNVRIITNTQNMGFAKACNQGAATAKTPHLLFLNNDTIPTKGWLEAMLEVVETHPNVGIVGSKLLFPNGTLQHAGVIICDFPFPISPYHVAYRQPSDYPMANQQREYQCVTAACMLIRKKLFVDIGGFDESYINGYEDVDLCFKAKKRGWRIVYTPRSVVYHLEGQTPGRKAKELLNCELLNQRWEGRIKPDRILESLSIVIVTFNSSAHLGKCIDSILSSASLPYEIIIIDNNSSDDTAKILREYQDKSPILIKIVINKHNLGFSRACNQGLELAKGKYCVLLNPDTIVTPSWDKRLASHLETGVGAVGPLSNYVAGAQNISLYFNDRDLAFVGNDINKISELVFNKYAGTNLETRLLIGFCIMFKTEVLKSLGGLDDNLFLGNDDLDVSWRLRLNGYKLLIAKDTFIYHKGQASFDTRPSNETKQLVQQSTDALAQKLIDHYGFGQVPLPEELWGIDWFRPSKKYLGMFKQPQKKVSIVVLNYKLPDDTLECIQSIYRNIYNRFQIIVVDNGSGDRSVEKFLEWAKGSNKKCFCFDETVPAYSVTHFEQELILVKVNDNRGFTGGNNIGLKHALNNGADYMWFLNNDTVIEKDALFELIRAAEQNDAIGIVCSKLYVYGQHGKVQYDGKKAIYEGFPDSREQEQPFFTSAPSGCSMLVRKEVIDTIGLWDEDYFLYFDDNDLAIRATKKGWKIYYTPYSKVYHKGGSSTGGWLNTPLAIYYFVRNYLVFSVKHREIAVSKALDYIKAQAGTPILKQPSMLAVFVRAIEDFLCRRWGKSTVNFELGSGMALDNRPLQFHYPKSREKEAEFKRLQKKLLSQPAPKNLKTFLRIVREISEIEFPPTLTEIQRTIAYAESLYESGETEKSIALFEKILEVEPCSAQVHSSLASIYWENREIEKALSHITKAMEIAPDDRDVIWNAALIMSNLNLLDEACQMLKHYLSNHPEDKEIEGLLTNIAQIPREVSAHYVSHGIE